jgi:hypothetical protein
MPPAGVIAVGIVAPLPAVLAGISITIELLSTMSTELLSSEANLDIQIEEENHDDDQTLKNIDQEIECPRSLQRYYDIDFGL